jgi:uncharacterized membrane protein
MELLTLVLLLLGSFATMTALGRPRGALTSRRGRISLALVFLLTGATHFIVPGPMADMLPPWVPERLMLIYLTGVAEVAGAVGLLSERWARPAGVCLFLFLILVFPANVYAAFQRVPLGGHAAGPVYLIARAPVQLFLVWWTYWFAVRRNAYGYRSGVKQ